MTNPVPTHAPKTDTPATQEPVPQSWLNGMPRKQLIHLVQIAQSALFAAESTLAAERASRVQAEEALRKSEEAMLSGNQMDGMGERYVIDGAPLIEALTSIRAYFRALSKPSVSPEQEKP